MRTGHWYVFISAYIPVNIAAPAKSQSSKTQTHAHTRTHKSLVFKAGTGMPPRSKAAHPIQSRCLSFVQHEYPSIPSAGLNKSHCSSLNKMERMDTLFCVIAALSLLCQASAVREAFVFSINTSESLSLCFDLHLLKLNLCPECRENDLYTLCRGL